MNPFDLSAILAMRSSGVVGVERSTRSMPLALHTALSSPVSSRGMSGTSKPFAPAAAIDFTNGSNPRW